MLVITHLIVSLALTKLLEWNNLILALIGAIIPDLDYKLGLKHRGITHSLLFTLPFFILPSLGLGVASHVVLDLLTKTGTQLLYPHKDYYILLGGKLRTGEHDLIISTAFMVAILL